MSAFRDRLSKLEQKFALQLLAEATKKPIVLTRYRGGVGKEDGWGSWETLKKAAENLEELGLVRQEQRGHTRAIYLVITEKGNELMRVLGDVFKP